MRGMRSDLREKKDARERGQRGNGGREGKRTQHKLLINESVVNGRIDEASDERTHSSVIAIKNAGGEKLGYEEMIKDRIGKKNQKKKTEGRTQS